MFGFLFATLLLPMFARMLRQDRSGASVRPLVSLGFKLIWAGSITLASAVFLARQDLVQLMMPLRATAYRWDTLGILIWTFVPVSVTYIFSTLLTASGRLMAMNRFFALGLVLGTTLNLTLIPIWQAVGSAWATLVTQSFIAAAMVFLCFRFFPLKPSWKGILQVGAFAVLVPAAQTLIYSGLDVAWYWRFVLALVSGLAGLLALRLVDWRGLKALTPTNAKSQAT
jgi:O-antigen/teichoic acid export membrane protein